MIINIVNECEKEFNLNQKNKKCYSKYKFLISD